VAVTARAGQAVPVAGEALPATGEAVPAAGAALPATGEAVPVARAARVAATSPAPTDRRMSARNRELLALFPVALLLIGGFTAVFIVESDQIGDLSLIYGGYFFALCLAAHFLIRLRLPNADPYLFPLAALLAAVGLVVVYRIDDGLAGRQATLFLLGLIFFAATIIFLRDYHVLERYRYLIAVGSIALLMSPLLPGVGGTATNGAYLTLNLGPLSFQPSELGKIGVVIFLASYLAENREMLSVAARRFMGVTIPPLKHFGPLLVVWGAAMMMLVFIRDLGSSLMFFGAFLALLYVATSRISYVIIGLGMFLLGGAFFARSVSHVQDRFDIWLDPFAKNAPDGAGQIQQSLFAQADGGLFGSGLGESLLRLPGPFFPDTCKEGFPFCGSILPEPHTDFIYAVIVSELGLFGGAGLILIYALITARGFKTSVMAKDAFSKLLAAGLTAVFALQTFVIIGGVTKVIPLTGVTLPFVSYGGSSVIANMILIALLLLISNEARQPMPDRQPGDDLEGAPA
jgi:cell division protein FtsW (lipid II flippase)